MIQRLISEIDTDVYLWGLSLMSTVVINGYLLGAAGGCLLGKVEDYFLSNADGCSKAAVMDYCFCTEQGWGLLVVYSCQLFAGQAMDCITLTLVHSASPTPIPPVLPPTSIFSP